jgi:hypothetical protein
MTKINQNTKAANHMVYDLMHNTSRRTIWDAYTRPSDAKVNSYEAIRARALNTPGYNRDLHIAGAGSHNYSTVYSYTIDGKTYVVKDTKSNTYITEV